MKLQKQNKTITTYLIAVVAVIIIVQFTMITGYFVFGGILSGVRENAYLTLDNVVENRINYLQNEINSRWTYITPVVNGVRDKLEIIDESGEKAFFLSIEKDMVAMMNEARVTDCYVILDNQGEGTRYPALYLRDEDPSLDDAENRDISLLAGPQELINHYSSIGDWWNEEYEMKEDSSEFYSVPFQAGDTGQRFSELGYWSGPFRFKEEDSPRMTYSMPLVDGAGVTRGVIGIAVSESYMNRYLPSGDMARQDSLGYIIARTDENGGLLPVITQEACQDAILDLKDSLLLEPVETKENIYAIRNSKGNQTIYACIEEMGLYCDKSPYTGENWYLIGLQEKGRLLELDIRIKKVLFGTMIFSLLFSIAIGFVGFYRLTRPIAELAKKVNSRNISEEITLERTGFYELDELEKAIETEHRNFMDAQNKISQVVDIVEIPIGVFRYKNGVNDIMATTKLPSILGFSEEEKEELLRDSGKFMERLRQIMENEDAEHSGIYKLSETPEKWIKINVVEQEHEILGVVIDITQEQQETARLRKERNYDVLTGLCSRRYFRDSVKGLLEDGDLGVCAGMMFDVDEFKRINDSYGHTFGDKYLKDVARYLMEMSSTGCIVGRRSGDEFCAFLYDFGSREEIRNIIHEFYRKLRDSPLLLPDRANQIIEVSAGIAWYDKDSMTYDSLYDKADRALYDAKKNFKGYFVETE